MSCLKSLFVIVCITLMLAVASNAAINTDRLPDGAYCGSYAYGLIVGRFNTTWGSDVFDIKLSGAAGEAECKNEKYIYDPKTHTAEVVGAKDPNDCLGKLLTDNKLSLTVLFDPKEDVVTLDLGITVINCPKCKPDPEPTTTSPK